MTEDEFQAFAVHLIAVHEVFERDEVSESRQLLYFRALQDFPLASVIAALDASVKTCRFMPKPADLRALIGGDPEDQAERAWLEYKRAARQIGGYRSPAFEDGALAETLLAVFGSWENACWMDLSPEMWASKRKEFGRVYRVYQQRQVPARQLVGFVERDNLLRGFDVPSEALVPYKPQE
jgi:hypothetical protein